MGRNDVELEREAVNIFHQKYDPLFKQEFIKNDKGEMEVTAYYINHAPYSLVRSLADFGGYDFKALDGNYTNSETSTEIGVRHTEMMNYEIKIGTRQKTTGILVAPGKMLVNSYTLHFDAKNGLLLLDGERVRRVVFRK